MNLQHQIPLAKGWQSTLRNLLACQLALYSTTSSGLRSGIPIWLVYYRIQWRLHHLTSHFGWLNKYKLAGSIKWCQPCIHKPWLLIQVLVYPQYIYIAYMDPMGHGSTVQALLSSGEHRFHRPSCAWYWQRSTPLPRPLLRRSGSSAVSSRLDPTKESPVGRRGMAMSLGGP